MWNTLLVKVLVSSFSRTRAVARGAPIVQRSRNANKSAAVVSKRDIKKSLVCFETCVDSVGIINVGMAYCRTVRDHPSYKRVALIFCMTFFWSLFESYVNKQSAAPCTYACFRHWIVLT